MLLQEMLGEPNRCEALAVDARQELDLKCGVAFTRFQTRFFQVPPSPELQASRLHVPHMADAVQPVNSSIGREVFAVAKSWAWLVPAAVMNASLFMCMQGKYGNLDASVISYGPCQTPTLAFCVQRHQIMTAFQPEDFWSVRPHISKAGQRCKLPLKPVLSVSRAQVTQLTCVPLPEPFAVCRAPGWRASIERDALQAALLASWY